MAATWDGGDSGECYVSYVLGLDGTNHTCTIGQVFDITNVSSIAPAIDITRPYNDSSDNGTFAMSFTIELYNE